MKMKNKKENQKADRQKHRDELKKHRRNEVGIERHPPDREEKLTFLIVCEGENTEPSYFSQFRLSSVTIEISGIGFNTLSLVEKAKEYASEKHYDRVWVVFDKDETTDDSFNRAILMAENENFGVAYSNQAFEYWLILHLIDHQGERLHRKEYGSKINSKLKPHGFVYDYKKSKIISEELFEFLKSKEDGKQKTRMEQAIDRAKRNYDVFDHASPAKEESSTTVFKLVEELLRYI